MRPRSRFEYAVAEANDGLRLWDLTEGQRRWAFRTQVEHYAYRHRDGKAVCLDCGAELRPEGRDGSRCRCPECGRRLKIVDTRKVRCDEKAYFSTLTVCGGMQVQRVFLITAHYYRCLPASCEYKEIARWWMDESGHTAVTALPRNSGGYYYDTFTPSYIELRRPQEVYRMVADCEVYPRYTALAVLRRNGLRGMLPKVWVVDLMKALLTDPRVETMMKSGRKAHIRYFMQHPKALDDLWPSYRITLRNRYDIADIGLWVDMVRMLGYCGRDTRNAHYVCPADLRAAHDRWRDAYDRQQELRTRERQRAVAEKSEAEFEREKGRYLGVVITDGELDIRPLQTVADYFAEGEAMHHCVGSMEYYRKPGSLVLSARIGGRRVETVEVSLDTMRVVQSRGVCNESTPYHDRIINLVESKAEKFRKA